MAAPDTSPPSTSTNGEGQRYTERHIRRLQDESDTDYDIYRGWVVVKFQQVQCRPNS